MSNVSTVAAGGTPVAESSRAAAQTVGKDAFLKLLVSQIRNQDPLNPADGVQFLTQLAQFSELEQMIEIRGGLANIENTLASIDGRLSENSPAESKSGADRV